MSTEISFDPDPTGETGLTGVADSPVPSAVAVTDVATQVVPNRNSGGAVTIQNANVSGGDNVYVGNEGVTDATGLQLQPGEGITLNSSNSVYAICSSGQTADVRVLQDG